MLNCGIKEFLAAFWAAEFPHAPLPARQNKSTIVTCSRNTRAAAPAWAPLPAGGFAGRREPGRGRGLGASAERGAATHSPCPPWEEKHESQPTHIPSLPSEPTPWHGTDAHGMVWLPRAWHGYKAIITIPSTAASGRAVVKRPFAPCSRVSDLSLLNCSHLPGSVLTLAPRQGAPNPRDERWGVNRGAHTTGNERPSSPHSILHVPLPSKELRSSPVTRGRSGRCSGSALPCKLYD